MRSSTTILCSELHATGERTHFWPKSSSVCGPTGAQARLVARPVLRWAHSRQCLGALRSRGCASFAPRAETIVDPEAPFGLEKLAAHAGPWPILVGDTPGGSP